MKLSIFLTVVVAAALLLANNAASQECTESCGPRGMCYTIPGTTRSVCSCQRCWDSATNCREPINTPICQSKTSTNRRVVVSNPVAITDPCDPNPCMGAGNCQVTQGQDPGYRCTCDNNRTGPRCETLLPTPRNRPAAASPTCTKSCGPRGMCYIIPGTSRSVCSCQRCWDSATNCQEPINTPTCQSRAVPNRRVVVSNPVAITDSSPCNPNPCMGTGYCQVIDQKPGYRCTCVNNRSGKRCRTLLATPRNRCEGVTCPAGKTCRSPAKMIGYMCS